MTTARSLRNTVRILKSLFLLTFVVAAFAWLGCSPSGVGKEGEPKTSPPSLEDEAARVNGRPLLVEDVVPLLAAPQARPEDVPSPVNPRRKAFDAAVRVKLFAEEAKRRGIEVPKGDSPELVEAALVQDLVRQELDARSAEAMSLQTSITPGDLSRFYSDHENFFAELGSVELRAIVLEDPALAEGLLEEAQQADEDEFQRLVLEHSEDRASRSKVGYLRTFEADHATDRSGTKLGEGDEKTAVEEHVPDEIEIR